MNTILSLSMKFLAKIFLFKQPPFRVKKHVCQYGSLRRKSALWNS